MLEPDLAPVDLEKKMEARDLPEADRDELRRFAGNKGEARERPEPVRA